ncbi:MAG: transcriptional regulator NrdR [Myxococcota bacterium]
MRCPFCQELTSRVIDSRSSGGEIRRRRECTECQRRFTTREKLEAVLPKVVKRDERREEFRRDKLLVAVQKACEKRPVSAEDLDQLIGRVERLAQELGDKEVTSDFLGSQVLEELVHLDQVAAARYASVFHNFQNADDYDRFFASIKRDDRAR